MPKSGAPLLALVSDLVTWLKGSRVPWMVIGVVAASLLGRPRLTRDLDVLVALSERRWPKFLRSGAEQGFAPPTVETIELAHRTRVLGVGHEASGGPAAYFRLLLKNSRLTWFEFGASVSLGSCKVSPEDEIRFSIRQAPKRA